MPAAGFGFATLRARCGLRLRDSACPLRPSASRLCVPAAAFGFAALRARCCLRLRGSACPLLPSASRLYGGLWGFDKRVKGETLEQAD